LRNLAIYIHYPFCKSKCPYCDFNSHVRESVNDDIWLNAYLSELDKYKDEEAIITSIFFGGGTPSLMPAKTVEAIIGRIGKNWQLADDVEITLEANPTSVEYNKFN
jgi:oxygen-independent coproporphyrinogen-3 oxidase